MALLLERHEVEGLLDMKAAIEVTRGACAEQGRGHVPSHAPTMLHVDNGALRIVQGALLESKVIGARLTKAAGFPQGGSVAVICDADTGELLAVMSFPLGTLRTGAVVGLATEMLSRENAEVVGLIGTGQNAVSLLEGVMCVRSVKKIKVYSRDPAHRNRFAEEAGSALGVNVNPYSNPEEVVRGSDILLVATNSKVPVFDSGTMEAGLHVNSMGRPSELDPAVYRRAALTVVGDKHQETNLDLSRGFTQPLLELKEERGFWERILELGDLVCGRGGRKDEQEITVFRESQGGWGDVALGNWILKQARKQGLGRDVSF
jgi:ornithine cyclodeaminase/alanine dehydrogenase-like protein (mu-crystallin family)